MDWVTSAEVEVSFSMNNDMMTKSSSPEQLHALILAQENREVAG